VDRHTSRFFSDAIPSPILSSYFYLSSGSCAARSLSPFRMDPRSIGRSPEYSLKEGKHVELCDVIALSGVEGLTYDDKRYAIKRIPKPTNIESSRR
jgi:hypothetical protein